MIAAYIFCMRMPRRKYQSFAANVIIWTCVTVTRGVTWNIPDKEFSQILHDIRSWS